MKKVKIVLWIILLGITGLVVYQNKVFFSEKHSFMINFFVSDIYHSPELPNAVWFLACFSLGLLLAYFFSLMERFRSNRTIKDLKAKSESLLDMISQLRKELESRKSPVATAPAIEVEPVSTPDN
jgi:lipid-A-disaccharide synthase-like uncharacterized protein